MGSVVIDMSKSLDGYIAEPNDIRSRGWARKGCACTTGPSTILQWSVRNVVPIIDNARRWMSGCS